MSTITHKTCSLCKIEKKHDEFYCTKRGITSRCRVCQRGLVREWNKNNPEKHKLNKSASSKRVRRERAKEGDRCIVYNADRTEKRCPRCKTTKPIAEFCGVYCRLCGREMSRDWAMANPEKRHLWRTQNPERTRDAQRRHRRKLKENSPQVLQDKERHSTLARKGSTVQQFAALLQEQGGVCAICKGPPTAGRSYAIDHDHTCCPGRTTCGKCNRGLLCGPCNKLLNRLEHAPGWIQNATQYLLKYEPEVIHAA